MSKKKLISETIDAEDFKNQKSTILMANCTTETEVVDVQKIRAIELSLSSISVELPKNSCQRGHELTLYIFSRFLKNELKNLTPQKGLANGALMVTGRVSELAESHCSNKVIAYIKLTQFKENDWANFVNSSKDKQSDINDLCRLARM